MPLLAFTAPFEIEAFVEMRDAAKNVVAVHTPSGSTGNDNCLPLSGLRQLSRVRALNEYTRTGCTGYFILFLHVYKLKKLEYVDI